VELVIAEKPSVARDLSRVLGVRPSSGATSFESDRYVVTWCIGHLVELEEPAAYNPAWKAWRLDLLPMLPDAFRLRGAPHAIAQLRAVEKLLREKRFTTVINACDAGREGELIFRYVYQHANSRLPIRRLWISSLTDDAIRRGMASLRAGADLVPLADAARSRSEADWLVGLNATRAITARGRIAGHDTLWSIGRVQTPTLAMLVERERELRAFVPVPYWEVRARLPGFVATWRDGAASRIATTELADSLVARDTQLGSAVVERVRAKTVREPPPQLFDLTSLQRTANRRFGFSAQRTLELAQALYERHKLLTYPRTDSRHLTKDVAAELATPIAALANVPEYAAFAQQLVATPAMWQRANRRVVDDTKVSDHHAIIPTGAPVHLSSLDRDEARLFDLVARRFLGAFFPDAEFASTEAWLRVGPPSPDRPLREATDGERDAFVKALPAMPDRYLARGRVRTVAGWQDVAGLDPMRTARGDGRDARDGDIERATAGRDGVGRDAGRDGDRDDDREPTMALPPLVEGHVLPARFSSHAKQTTPPPRYTEATLLGAMETAGKRIDDEALRAAMKDTGLGTPATRASIIETLLRREYIARERTNLVATPLGESLIAQIPIASLASAELTGSWEARLAAIARGKDTRAAFMADIARYVHQIIDAVRGAPAPPAPPPGSSPPPAWQSRGKGKRPRGRGDGASSKPPRKKRATAASSESAPRKARAPKRPGASPPGAASSASASASSPSPASSSSMRTSTPSMPRSSDSRAMRAATLSTPSRADSTRADLSVESTAWLADLVMTMAPKKNE
jgi:DNA topoisomerase-3